VSIKASVSRSGAVGGEITGTELGDKYHLDVTSVSSPFATRVDDASSTVTYIGKAATGTAAATAAWQIQRSTISGTETIIEWADGNTLFDNQWSNRASLSYS
jgi:hypothetical protein